MSRTRRRIVRRAVALALLSLVVVAGPAAADPPGPTNYDARVLEIDPPTQGVEAAVLGGDSFLQLRVAEGTEVVVRGYDDAEVYLRFDADGQVFENRRALSYYQNQSRYEPSAADRPAEVGPDVPPDWVLVSTDGTFAWHDHRIHWMSPTQPPFRADTDGDAVPVDFSSDEVQPTTVWVEPVPILVDGEEVGIVGEVLWLPDASPLPTALAALLALGGVLAFGWRRPAAGIVAGVVLGTLAALAVGVPQVVGLAAGVEAQPLTIVIPLIAVLVVGAGLSVRSRSAFALVVAGAAGIPLLGWVVTNLGAITAPIVPPAVLPEVVVRAAVGLAAGGGLGALVLGIRDLLTGDALSLDPEPAPETA